MPTIFKNRLQHQPIIQMADGRPAAIGVIGEDHIAFFQRALIGLHEAMNKRSELSDDHFAIDIRDHRKRITLFANAGRHGGPKQRCVHFFARIAQSILNNVERNGVNIELGEWGVVGLNNFICHNISPSSANYSATEINKLDWASTVARWPGKMTVVLSISVMTAGPTTSCPVDNFDRS